MKIEMTVDLTPEELRRLMGLPDVEAFNRELMESMAQQMRTGTEGYDPVSLFQAYQSNTQAGLDMFRRFYSGVAGAAARPTGED